MFDKVSEKLATWELIFNDNLNCHMPIVKKRVKRKCLSPWTNKEIMHLLHLRDQFKSRAKSNILARLMSRIYATLANAKAAHMRNEIMENMNSPKKLWKIINQVAPTKPRPTNFSFMASKSVILWEFQMLSTNILPTFKKPISLFQTA